MKIAHKVLFFSLCKKNVFFSFICLCLNRCTVHGCECPLRRESVGGLPAAGITRNCNSSNVGAGNQLRSSERASALNPEP